MATCSLSPDGKELVTSAFSGENDTHKHRNAVIAIQTSGDGSRVLYETDDFVGHAQYSPDGRQVLFSGNLPRLWLVNRDGSAPHPLRAQTKDEWITHESWLSDEEILFVLWPHALKAIRRDGSGERTIAAFNCWHPASHPSGTSVVCDTTLPDMGLQLVDAVTGHRRTLCYPQATSRGTQWALPQPIWDGPVVESAYGPQWTHPHPSFTPDGRAVVYTSDVSGQPHVYLAFVPGAPRHAD